MAKMKGPIERSRMCSSNKLEGGKGGERKCVTVFRCHSMEYRTRRIECWISGRESPISKKESLKTYKSWMKEQRLVKILILERSNGRKGL